MIDPESLRQAYKHILTPRDMVALIFQSLFTARLTLFQER